MKLKSVVLGCLVSLCSTVFAANQHIHPQAENAGNPSAVERAGNCEIEIINRSMRMFMYMACLMMALHCARLMSIVLTPLIIFHCIIMVIAMMVWIYISIPLMGIMSIQAIRPEEQPLG